ncbi:MAG: hypothetical protein JETCAE02_18910 [Anaerolineaceae bacterium]|nr:MAG: hypothetical protein BroJett001_19080 [Chloroflexota bacterium]GJQ39479.1 MAG: hypothetical protein JETCAE02_18910 [Anaerolineaceae bacterium]
MGFSVKSASKKDLTICLIRVIRDTRDEDRFNKRNGFSKEEQQEQEGGELGVEGEVDCVLQIV